MKIVIQCAGTKNQTPGAGFRTSDNRLVKFVADPKKAPSSGDIAYAHPDERPDGLQTWRERLLDYNKGATTNPLGLLPAYQLYKNPVYKKLVEKFGLEKVFILSAGWGLISADFLTPDYDITFSTARNVEPYCRRNKRDHYADTCILPDDGEGIIFLGGKDYRPLFCKLTANMKGMKKVFFNSSVDPVLGHGFSTECFPTKCRTNWHYSCAQALIDGDIGI